MNKYIKISSLILLSTLIVGAGLLDGRQVRDGSINLATKVNGVLPQANGGTGSTSFNSDTVNEGDSIKFYIKSNNYSNKLNWFLSVEKYNTKALS